MNTYKELIDKIKADKAQIAGEIMEWEGVLAVPPSDNSSEIARTQVLSHLDVLQARASVNDALIELVETIEKINQK